MATALRDQLLELMADQRAHTIRELAIAVNIREDAVRSSLIGMRNRREAVELKPKAHGLPRRYRLRSNG